MKQKLLLPFIFLILTGCNTQSEDRQKNEGKYFDLKEYFKREATKLNASKKVIQKTVSVDSVKEIRNIKIEDWNKELSSFFDSEINRESWRGVFKTIKTDSGIRYISDNEKVPVKVLDLIYAGDKLTGIKIVVKHANILYNSTDSLFYFPDSIYRIKKTQNIKLLSKKEYMISGKLN